MKWTREEPGRYTSGEWLITGEGRDWELFKNGRKVVSTLSKKEAQEHAEAANTRPTKTPPTPVQTSNLDIQTRTAPIKATVGTETKASLESCIASLRLSIDHLSNRIDAQTAAMIRIAEGRNPK